MHSPRFPYGPNGDADWNATYQLKEDYTWNREYNRYIQCELWSRLVSFGVIWMGCEHATGDPQTIRDDQRAQHEPNFANYGVKKWVHIFWCNFKICMWFVALSRIEILYKSFFDLWRWADKIEPAMYIGFSLVWWWLVASSYKNTIQMTLIIENSQQMYQDVNHLLGMPSYENCHMMFFSWTKSLEAPLILPGVKKGRPRVSRMLSCFAQYVSLCTISWENKFMYILEACTNQT